MSERAKRRDARLEERHRRIAERAYCLAESRNFQGGDPVQDWLTAEAEIDALSLPTTPRDRALRWKR